MCGSEKDCLHSIFNENIFSKRKILLGEDQYRTLLSGVGCGGMGSVQRLQRQNSLGEQRVDREGDGAEYRGPTSTSGVGEDERWPLRWTER